MPKSNVLTNAFHSLSILKFYICSKGHAQLKLKLDQLTSISLNSHAQEVSPTLEIQEYVNKMCSIDHYSSQSCWRVQDGLSQCEGNQLNYRIWIGLPYQLIFEPEPQSKAANDININGILSLILTLLTST